MALALMLATAGRGAAQTATVGVNVSVPTVLFISRTGDFQFGTVNDAAYMAGSVMTTAGPTLTHRGNVGYQITMKAYTGSGNNLGFTPLGGRSDADPGKPMTDLQLRQTTSGTAGGWMSVPGESAMAATFYTRATRGTTLTSTVDARLLLSYAADPPGTYSTTVVFTIVAQ
jgi:hypothetical protein